MYVRICIPLYMGIYIPRNKRTWECAETERGETRPRRAFHHAVPICCMPLSSTQGRRTAFSVAKLARAGCRDKHRHAAIVTSFLTAAFPICAKWGIPSKNTPNCLIPASLAPSPFDAKEKAYGSAIYDDRGHTKSVERHGEKNNKKRKAPTCETDNS